MVYTLMNRWIKANPCRKVISFPQMILYILLADIGQIWRYCLRNRIVALMWVERSYEYLKTKYLWNYLPHLWQFGSYDNISIFVLCRFYYLQNDIVATRVYFNISSWNVYNFIVSWIRAFLGRSFNEKRIFIFRHTNKDHLNTT